MDNENLSVQRAATTRAVLIRAVLGCVCGGLVACVVYGLTLLGGAWKFIVPGALLGVLVGVCWETAVTLWIRFRSEDWRVTEIELETLGQKWKLANSGSQRRVAWTIFVEAVSRIATQPMVDTEGDDGVALKSLYDLFQCTRKSISEMEPTRILPSRDDPHDTVETYALAMLNQDLRPFLSKWHPLWDAWRTAHVDVNCREWDEHKTFRTELRLLQLRIRERAEGLAEIAGVPEINRFFDGVNSNSRFPPGD